METYNERRVNLKTNRHEVCDILRALTHLYIDFDREAKDPDTSEDRRKIASSSAQHWKELRDNIRVQLEDFDQKNFKR